MAKTKLFISSVQVEFSEERQALYDYILADPLLGRFFDPFLFERLPAIDQQANEIYLREVEHCHIYLGLFGKKYGFEDAEGVSPTEREFDKASELYKTRLIYLTNHSTKEREAKQNVLINKAQTYLVRKRFSSIHELKAAVYASLVSYLIDKEIIRTGPFDASLHPTATIQDIDEEKVRSFVQIAHFKRGFPLPETAPILDIFTHLNLVHGERLTNAAILLFGKTPQRFFINSEVRCAHFHGYIVEKPIPSYKVFKGDVFELIDQAEDFVLSKLDYSIGTRAEATSIPSKYEIPKEIISEAIVNAVAHRDYTQNGSVQIMLFRDRLEILNPGVLPLGWSIDKLKKPHPSVPFNPLLAEPMYLKGYIERMGTGTADIVRLAKENNLQEPVFEQNEDFKTIIYRSSNDIIPIKYPPSTRQVPTKYPSSINEVATELRNSSVEIQNLLNILECEMSRKEIQEKLRLKDKVNFRLNYLEPAITAGLIQMKYPTSPNHPRQKYLLTEEGSKHRN